MFKTAREKVFQVILDVICVLLFSALVVFSVDGRAEEIPESLTKKLAEVQGAERGQIIAVKDEALARVLSGYSFYVLRFKQFPVAVLPPPNR